MTEYGINIRKAATLLFAMAESNRDHAYTESCGRSITALQLSETELVLAPLLCNNWQERDLDVG